MISFNLFSSLKPCCFHMLEDFLARWCSSLESYKALILTQSTSPPPGIADQQRKVFFTVHFSSLKGNYVTDRFNSDTDFRSQS